MTAALFDLPPPHVRWFDAGLPWPCWEWCRCGVGVAHEGAQEAQNGALSVSGDGGGLGVHREGSTPERGAE